MRFTINKLLFLVVFLIPVVCIAFYEVFVATDRYESVASIIITEERSVSQEVDLSLLGITGGSSDKDALVLKEFIESRGMLKFLDAAVNLKAHFKTDQVDPVTRLGDDASLEEFHEYFLDFMKIEYDTESKLLKFSFQAFDRQFAQKVVKTVLSRSQEFVDRLNAEVTREQLKFFDDQIVKSERRLREAKERLVLFQRKHGIIDVTTEGATIMSTIAGLELALATKQAELDASLQGVDSDAPQIKQMKREISGLSAIIKKERDRLAGTSKTNSLSELDSEFREIQLGLEFNTNIYKANLNALEQARLEAARRLKFLIVVAEPSLADESEFPDRPYIIATWAMVLLIVYFVISLMVAIVREHS